MVPLPFQLQLALCIHGIYIRELNQPWMDSRMWNSWIRRPYCTTPFTYMGLEHPPILVSVGGVLEPIPHGYQGMTEAMTHQDPSLNLQEDT